MAPENVQYRATYPHSGEKTADYGLDYGQVLRGRILIWPVASGYSIAPGGVIAPEPGRHPYFDSVPLRDPELYLSFARLAHGASRMKRILDWVSEYGLLTRKNPAMAGSTLLEGGMVNQHPMTIEVFVGHVTKFDNLLRLYVEVSSGNFRSIALRINRRASVVDDRLAAARRAEISRWVHPHLSVEYGSSYAGHPLLWLADQILCEMLAQELDGIRIRPVSGFDKSWETTEEELTYINSLDRPPYTPTDSFTCPDLLGALYLQLFLVIRRRKPVRRCEGCGVPLPETAPKNKRHHDATCRSNARHRRERSES